MNAGVRSFGSVHHRPRLLFGFRVGLITTLDPLLPRVKTGFELVEVEAFVVRPATRINDFLNVWIRHAVTRSMCFARERRAGAEQKRTGPEVWLSDSISTITNRPFQGGATNISHVHRGTSADE